MEVAKAKDATPSSAAGPSGGSASGLTGAIVGTIMSNIHARVNRLSEPELNQEHLQQVMLTANPCFFPWIHTHAVLHCLHCYDPVLIKTYILSVIAGAFHFNLGILFSKKSFYLHKFNCMNLNWCMQNTE